MKKAFYKSTTLQGILGLLAATVGPDLVIWIQEFEFSEDQSVPMQVVGAVAIAGYAIWGRTKQGDLALKDENDNGIPDFLENEKSGMPRIAPTMPMPRTAPNPRPEPKSRPLPLPVVDLAQDYVVGHVTDLVEDQVEDTVSDVADALLKRIP